jgi:nucleoside diphosphate kinase
MFYAEHQGKPFYDGLVAFMSSGPIVALALAKSNAILAGGFLRASTQPTLIREPRFLIAIEHAQRN